MLTRKDPTLTRRFNLSDILRKLLVDVIGVENATYKDRGRICYKVYFQPDINVKLQYPCILYHNDTGDTEYADNYPYRFTKRYMVTVIDKDPDSQIPYHVAMLQMCRMDRAYTVNNLNHWTFNLYH